MHEIPLPLGPLVHRLPDYAYVILQSRPDTPEDEHERMQPAKRTQEVTENKGTGIFAISMFGKNPQPAPSRLKNAEMWLAADERRSTLIENKWFIRVHPRLSAVQNRLPGPNIVLLGQITFLNRSIGLVRIFQRKRPKIKQIGRFQSVYLAQSVHAPITP